MKHILYLFIATAGLWLAACTSGNSSKNNSGENSGHATSAVEETVDNQSAEAENPKFDVKDGRIIPANGRPVIVDFYADWCPPCQRQKPIFEKLRKEFSGRIDFISIDVDANEDIAANYVGRGIPTLAFILPNGETAATIEGLQSEEDLRMSAEELLSISNERK